VEDKLAGLRTPMWICYRESDRRSDLEVRTTPTRLSQVAICTAINQLSDLFTTNHTANWPSRLMNSNPKRKRDEDQEHNRVDNLEPAHHPKIDLTDRPCQVPERSDQHR